MVRDFGLLQCFVGNLDAILGGEGLEALALLDLRLGRGPNEQAVFSLNHLCRVTWVGRGVCAVCARDGEPRAITPRRVLFKLCRQLRVNGSKNQIVYEQIGTDPPQIRFPIWDNRGFAKILFPPDLGLGIFSSRPAAQSMHPRIPR